MSVVFEDEHDAEELKAVDALRQALMQEEVLPAKHDDYHLLLRSLPLSSVPIMNAYVSNAILYGFHLKLSYNNIS